MQLSKTQVLGLLLGTISAATIQEVLNGSSSADTATLGDGQSLTTANSLTACAGGNAECTTATETCGNVQVAGATQGDPVTVDNLCVDNWVCDTVGKVGGLAFSVQCWATAETPVAPATVDPAALLASVGTIILDDDQNWDANADLRVPSLDNFQTGWWTLGAEVDAKWTETDKAAINKCVANSACAAEQCCANWPDTNNRRCIDKTKGGVAQTIAPFQAFTPVCAVDANAPPKSASDDLAEKAQAKAAQDLSDFFGTVKEGAKADIEGGWDALDDEAKAAWEADYAAVVVKRDAFEAKLRADAGYAGDDCDNDCKSVFDAEFLKWNKAVYQTCKDDPNSIECRDFEKLKEAEETLRNEGGFYSKNADERSSFEAAAVDAKEQAKAGLIAAFMADNKPSAGQEGADCDAMRDCEGENQCCGTATPESNAIGVTTGQITNICVSRQTQTYTDGLNRQYSHQCGAKALLASAAAALAAALLV